MLTSAVLVRLGMVIFTVSKLVCGTPVVASMSSRLLNSLYQLNKVLP